MAAYIIWKSFFFCSSEMALIITMLAVLATREAKGCAEATRVLGGFTGTRLLPIRSRYYSYLYSHNKCLRYVLAADPGPKPSCVGFLAASLAALAAHGVATAAAEPIL